MSSLDGVLGASNCTGFIKLKVDFSAIGDAGVFEAIVCVGVDIAIGDACVVVGIVFIIDACVGEVGVIVVVIAGVDAEHLQVK